MMALALGFLTGRIRGLITTLGLLFLVLGLGLYLPVASANPSGCEPTCPCDAVAGIDPGQIPQLGMAGAEMVPPLDDPCPEDCSDCQCSDHVTFVGLTALIPGVGLMSPAFHYPSWETGSTQTILNTIFHPPRLPLS